MRYIALSDETDLAGWREAARALASAGVRPESVEWRVGPAPSLLSENAAPASAAAVAPSTRFTVPRGFLALAGAVVLHSDAARFALLYRLLWRLRTEPRLLAVAIDPDVARAEAMVSAVRRDMHKMKAFVRFREIATDAGPRYLAWFEPEHHIVAATAPFFARRVATRMWSILTPRASAHWDGRELVIGAGAQKSDAHGADSLEALWRTYYASIFNPARLKVAAMQKEMPKKYWRNLPEAEIISPLIASAHRRTQEMVARTPSPPRKGRSAAARPRPAAEGTLEAVRREAEDCRDCPLWKDATQTVFGEGATRRGIMLVGEQPGDKEDLEGRPFVGPAGHLLDRALAEAGIARDRVYVTNAVKHFKFELRGKRRLHKKPAEMEIAACHQWLERELELVEPALIVALGATAARALLGRATPIERNRGRVMEFGPDAKLLITVHPSYLLRVPEEDKPREYRKFVADLKVALPFADHKC